IAWAELASPVPSSRRRQTSRNRQRARRMLNARDSYVSSRKKPKWADYIAVALHFPVPVLGLGARGPEDFHVPFAASPGFDHFGGDDINEQLRELASLRISFEVIGRLVPPEIRVEHHRQEEIVSIIDHDQLSAGTLERGVVDEIFLRAVRADVAF